MNNEIVCNILRRVKNSNIYTTELNNIFNSSELAIINNLYMDESIINVFDIEKKNELVTLTKKGKFLLFSHDYREAIETFAMEIENKGLDSSYLCDYLKSSDLDRKPSEIFSISDYELFVHNLKKFEDSRVARRIMLRNNRNIG